MTINDVRNLSVDRFCAVIKAALESGQITGKQALSLIIEFYRELKVR